jgi:hypothetical protein
MNNITSEVIDNFKLLLNEMSHSGFLLKMIILFIIYLFSNYIFDRINNEDLIRTFIQNPTMTIQIPNNTTFKILITIFMVIISHFTYILFIKPIIYKNKDNI